MVMVENIEEGSGLSDIDKITESSNGHLFVYERYPSGFESVIEVDGFHISSDKCAYECIYCKAIYMSKNISIRSIFATDDPRSGKICTNKEGHDLKRICKCEEIIR